MVPELSAWSSGDQHDGSLVAGSPSAADFPLRHLPMSGDELRLLIVEDTEATRELLRSAFKDSAYTIDFARDGHEAVAFFRNYRYDVVITDLQMPIVDGLTASRRMRELEARDPTRGRTPIVALTAGASNADRETCLKAGMDAYLTKPIDLSQLFATLKQVRSHSDERERNRTKVTEPSNTILNLQAALARLQGNETLYRSLVGFFLDDHGTYVTAIKSGLADADCDAVRQAAHTLKGLAAGIGGEAVVSLSGSIEQLTKDENLREAAERFTELEASIDGLKAELRPFTESASN